MASKMTPTSLQKKVEEWRIKRMLKQAERLQIHSTKKRVISKQVLGLPDSGTVQLPTPTRAKSTSDLRTIYKPCMRRSVSYDNVHYRPSFAQRNPAHNQRPRTTMDQCRPGGSHNGWSRFSQAPWAQNDSRASEHQPKRHTLAPKTAVRPNSRASQASKQGQVGLVGPPKDQRPQPILCNEQPAVPKTPKTVHFHEDVKEGTPATPVVQVEPEAAATDSSSNPLVIAAELEEEMNSTYTLGAPETKDEKETSPAPATLTPQIQVHSSPTPPVATEVQEEIGTAEERKQKTPKKVEEILLQGVENLFITPTPQKSARKSRAPLCDTSNILESSTIKFVVKEKAPAVVVTPVRRSTRIKAETPGAVAVSSYEILDNEDIKIIPNRFLEFD